MSTFSKAYQRTYNLFISHAWNYCDDYYRLRNLLNSDPGFNWKNYSVPTHDPFDRMAKYKLQEEIKKQLSYSSVVLFIAGMYVMYRDWIQFEIDLADKFEKPIICVRPYQSQRIPSLLTRSDIEQVYWRRESIIDAIVRNAKD